MGITQDLCAYDGKLYAAWKGITGDTKIWYSFFNGRFWTEQRTVEGHTSAGPAMAKHGKDMYLAWKGMHSDPRLFSLKVTGGLWSHQAEVPGKLSSVGPSLSDYNGRLHAAWKGKGADQAIYWASTGDGASWSGQQAIPGVATSVGPSLCGFDGRLYAAWKGMNNDQGIYYASYDGSQWSAQAGISGVGTSVGPTLATFRGRLYAIWKGIIGDDSLYMSSFDGHAWAPQQLLKGMGSSEGVALAAYGDRLYALWKGAGADQQLYFSSFDGTSWAPQQAGPGQSGQDRPINIGVPLQYQETTLWCWLAAAASIAHFYRPASPTSQCGLMTSIGKNINKWVGVACCPTSAMLNANPAAAAGYANPYALAAEGCLDNVGLPAQCIKSGGVGDALNVDGHRGDYHDARSASLDAVAAELAARRPVAVDITWKSGVGSHVLIVAGVLNDQLLILDPGSGESVVPYETLLAGAYGAGATFDGFQFTKP